MTGRGRIEESGNGEEKKKGKKVLLKFGNNVQFVESIKDGNQKSA